MPPVILAIAAVLLPVITGIGVGAVTASIVAVSIASLIVVAGTGLVIWGVGTLLSSAAGALGPNGTGVQLSAAIDPLAPWNVVYGYTRVGGNVIFRNAFGDNDKYLDIVIILACHPSESVDWLLFDNQKIQMPRLGDSDFHTTPNGWATASFTPLQQTILIPSTSDITRTNNVVTVVLNHDIPLLEIGDQINISGVHPVNLLFNGRFPVTNVIHTPGSPGAVTFSYLCGGPAVPGSGTVVDSGQVFTAWQDYQRKIYMEVMLGSQTLGETFQGMLTGTPYDGDWTNLQQNTSNPWNSTCSLLGKTCVFLRLHYSDTYFGSGLPQIAFLLHGKNDILDPRTSPPSRGYSNNSALCIADYLSNTTWGYKASYGTEIPSPQLISAANICDEQVILAEPVSSPPATESRYSCDGSFPLSITRGQILGNLLTSCAGRLTDIGGQFSIYPGAWQGISATLTGSDLLGMLVDRFQWRATTSILNLVNGVKGTYIAPFNNWSPSDFPRYAQDVYHGYSWGSAPLHDANLDADGGDRRWLDVQLPFTTSPSRAQRIAKIELLRRRNQGTGTFPLNMKGYPFVSMDVLAVDLPFFGWSGKTLEILLNRLKLSTPTDGSAPSLFVEIDVQETDSSIYSWSIGEELSPQGYQQAIVPDVRTPSQPTDFLGSSSNSNIYLTWTPPADAFVLQGGHIEIEYQLVASPEGLWISLAKMDPTIAKAEIDNLLGGSSYNVQIRSVNAAGVPSDWLIVTPSDSSPLTQGPILVNAPIPPGSLTYTPSLLQFGVLTVENVLVAAGGILEGIDWYLTIVDELTSDVFVTTNSSCSNSTDPLTIGVTGNPSRTTDALTLDFAIGQWILWNDTGSFEIGLLTNITGSWPNLTFTIQRHYPGEAIGKSTFEAPMTSHSSGIQLFIIQVRRFLLNSQTGAFNGAIPPTRFDMPIPAVCVCAVVAAPYNGAYGTWVTYNCATATIPGIRTCVGGDFVFPLVPGTLTANPGTNVAAAPGFQVPFKMPLRVNLAYLSTAPTGASVKVNVRVSHDGGTTWNLIEQLVISAGSTTNWPGIDPPGGRQAPYDASLKWPFLVLGAGDILNQSIEQAGSTIHGSDLQTKVDT